MASFYELVYNGVKPYMTYITIAIIVIIFYYVVRFAYDRYYEKPKDEKKFKGYENGFPHQRLSSSSL